jgi:hypothetical protein
MTRCLSTLPDQITAGLDFQAVVALAQYPAPAWGLTAVIRGPQAIDLTSTADGTNHVFTADAATTTTWQAGAYWFSLRATNGSQTFEASAGQLTIIKDLAAVTEPYDGRTQNAIALAAIDAVIAKRATQDQQRYKINERELWRTPIADLLKLRAYYAMLVARENAKASGRSRFGRPVIVKFSQ